jgi:NTE family protein
MNQSRRDVLVGCLSAILGEGHDSLIAEALPLLEWVELNGGQTLVREGDPADAVYFVVSGRLRAHALRAGERVEIDEIIRGETVGEASVLMKERHSTTIMAVRDSVLARMPASGFEELWRRHPEFSARMARLTIGQVRRAGTPSRRKKAATICIVPISGGFDIVALVTSLVSEIRRWGEVTLQARETVESQFGAGAADARPAEERYHRLSAWLDAVEQSHDFTVLVADDGETEWTRRCVRHADEVLFVTRVDAKMRIHPIEERLCAGERSITAARQSLVLLHPDWKRHPTGTAAWIDRRPVDMHYHVRAARPRDIGRLARILTGNATGLVLSGGGARGFAHLGAYKAIEESGIEIDFVGGTSIGAVMSAYVSFDKPAAELIDLARRAFARNPTGDFNLLPLVSLFKGRRLRRVIHDAVVAATGTEADILDSWRTLFCVASSYSGAREVVLTRGALDRALRASVSIPVALPPVPCDGELLVDGGLFNNFPTDIMTKMGARRLIGVDLSRRSSESCTYDEIPGSWTLLRNMFSGARSPGLNIPSLGTLLVGTTLLYSESRREQSRASVDLYINPDLSAVGLLEWKAFDKTIALGYEEAGAVLSSSGSPA